MKNGQEEFAKCRKETRQEKCGNGLGVVLLVLLLLSTEY